MSFEIESSILGAILDSEGPILNSNPGALIDQAALRPEDFNDPRVKVAWGIAQRLAAKRRPVDAMTVFASGRPVKAFSDGDLPWLQSLQGGNSLDREKFTDLLEGLRRISRGKILENTLKRGLLDLGKPGADLNVIASAIESSVRDLSSLVTSDGTGDQDVLEIASDWDRQESSPEKPVLIPTGIALLDEVIGGLPNNLTVIASLPGVGKSALMSSIIDAQIEAGLRVGLFGLEDGTKWLSKRILARDMGIPVRSIGTKTRTVEQGLKFSEVGSPLAEKMKRLTVFRHDTITADELCRRAASWIVNKGVQVIWVDHGGEIDHQAGDNDQHDRRVAETYRRLRNLAFFYSVPVVVLAHIRRPKDDDEDRPPKQTEIAESSWIERRARFILGLWEKKNEPNCLRATVLKLTEGEKNVTLKFERHREAAMIDINSGDRVNLFGEKMAELRKMREAREAEKLKLKEEAKKIHTLKQSSWESK